MVPPSLGCPTIYTNVYCFSIFSCRGQSNGSCSRLTCVHCFQRKRKDWKMSSRWCEAEYRSADEWGQAPHILILDTFAIAPNQRSCEELGVLRPSSPIISHVYSAAGYPEALEAAMRLSAEDVCGQLREGGVEFDPAMSKVSVS